MNTRNMMTPNSESQRLHPKRKRSAKAFVRSIGVKAIAIPRVIELFVLILAGCLISLTFFRENSNMQVDIIGKGVSDRVAELPDGIGVSDTPKSDCHIEDVDGGMVANAGDAFRMAGGGQPHLSVIVAPDSRGERLGTSLGLRFADLQLIETAESTGASCIVPDPLGPAGSQRIFTMRPKIDPVATSEALEAALQDCQLVVLGSMTADEDPVTQFVLDTVASRPGAETYLVLTSSQLKNPERALQLARKANRTQVNDIELEEWTGVKNDIVAGINWLREHGVSSVIVTAGDRGVVAYSDGWIHQRAFTVEPRRDRGAGDTLTGTVAAALAEGFLLPEAIRLGTAAAAMHVRKLPRDGGWDELRRFAATAPLLPFRPRRTVRHPRRVPESVKAAAYISTGAAAASLVIWLSAIGVT